MTLWAGRFAEEMTAAMAAVNRSLTTDIRLLPHDLQVNRAWTTALQQIGLLTATEVEAIHRALDTIASEAAKPAFAVQVAAFPDEDVHSFVERRVTELAGAAGQKIHTGRSRNDQVATDLRLYLTTTVEQLRAALHHAITALVTQARQHQETVMPGYTHLQQAQPVTLAHYLLSAAWMLRDDTMRLTDLTTRLDACPLGSGALAGSAYPIDRQALATALGFSAPTPNSMAAVSARDDCLEVVAACAILMTHLSRYAEDWILWSTQEFHFITLADSVSTGSSMMPQKKNPDSLELIRGKSARVIGQMQTLFTLLKGLPFTYARDLQEDKPALFDALDQTLASVALFTDVVSSVTFHAETMRAAIDPGVFATELADYLSRKGVPFRTAHAMVAGLMRNAIARKCDLRQCSVAELAALVPEPHRSAAKHFTDDVTHCFDPIMTLARRNLVGGTGPTSVAQQLKAFALWLRHTQDEPTHIGLQDT